MLKWWPPGQYYGPRIGSGFNILSNREKSFKKSSYQNATICEITKQASSDSMDSKLLKSWPRGCSKFKIERHRENVLKSST